MRPLAVAVFACGCLASSAAAWADATTAEVQAHQAYARGTAAFRRGDYATAAREYSAADALAPSPVALQAAIDAAVQADDPVLGTELVERARGSARTDALVTSMMTAQHKFAHRTGRIRLVCAAPPCLAAIDGVATDVAEPAIVRVGAHSVTLEAAGAVTRRSVTVAPDETIVVESPAAGTATGSAPAPAPAPTATPTPTGTPTPAPAHGLSPTWLFVGIGATAVAGGLTIASGVDTADRHSHFQSVCPGAVHCGDLASQGQSAQTRTNVLLGVTAALGVATLATAFLVRWHDGSSAGLSVAPGRVAFDARFWSP
ncbi:MAG TPA: hypothetical protein VIF15_08580 [Polyangiaceae bacterium]|jgi:hypothetical protein